MGNDVQKSGRSNSKVVPFSTPSNSQNLPAYAEICRLAIVNQPAAVGYLYDATKDVLLYKPILDIPSISVTLMKETLSPIVDAGILENNNLRRLIGMDKELCLSIYLNMTNSHGTSLLIKYPFTIDKHTRFFSYCCLTKQNHFSDEHTTIRSKSFQKSIAASNATHVVTEIKFGIHIIVVLQLVPEYESNLDRLLEKIQQQLSRNTFKIQPDEEDLLSRYTDITVFANIPQLQQLTKLVDLCQKIMEIKSEVSQHYPKEYTLRPIRSLYSSPSIETARYISLDQRYMDRIEPYLYQLSLVRKSLKIRFNSEKKELLEKYFKQQYEELQQQILKLEEWYKLRQNRHADLIQKIRCGNLEQDALKEPLVDEEDKTLLQESTHTAKIRNDLKEKADLIIHFKDKRFKYWNVKRISQNNDQDLETIKKQILKNEKRQRVYCFDDRLGKPHSSQWNGFYQKLKNEFENDPQSEFIYADFSYCLYQLSKWDILPSNDISDQQKSRWEEQSSKATNEPRSPATNFINVLLLGESGVGKSTFVNAIVNYLKFKTLNDARSGQPIVLMPVSFLITVGDQFEERLVRFGDPDSNEDHDHPGQSVTQHCKSYVFTIDTQTKIRLIDTPGMGDTRGLDQDDLNMQHILSFINNLSHLNAICILLKPNEARLNIVFRSYFTRLIGFLGENARNNIIFCFTNTRGTFFAPGDTGPLLKKMLESQSIKDIPFKKTNTFCFDNEAFRYLVARMQDIKFDDYQKEEYKRSWITSVNESNRLLEYMCSHLLPYAQKYWQSIEHAQFQVAQLVRPTLETIRNLFRNTILQKEKSSKLPIKLLPEALSCPSTICITCKRTPLCYSNFLILPDDAHIFSNSCLSCKCDRSAHVHIDYKLTYGKLDDSKKQSYDEMKSSLDKLKKVIIKFAYFHTHIVPHSKSNDPILITLTRMITEENQFCSSRNAKYFNSKLYNELNKLCETYQQMRNSPMPSENTINLLDIYELIKDITEIDSIKEQIYAIKKFHQNSMRDQEKNVS